MMITICIVGIFFCLLSEAFFSSAEISMVAMDKVRIRTLVSRGVKKAELISELLRRPDYLLGTTLLGTNVSTVLGSSIATYLVLKLFGPGNEYLAIVVMSPLILIFAEVLPKTLAQAESEKYALRYIMPLRFFRRLFFPAVWVMTLFSNLSTQLARKSVLARSPLFTREDLEYALKLSGRRGGLQKIERQMIHGILEFHATVVREAMIPLISVIAIDVKAKPEELIQAIMRYGISRVPVYEGRIDNLVGIVTSAELLDSIEGDELPDLQGLMKTPLFVPENKPIQETLKLFREKGEHMAIVVDEYGGAVGIVTVEDILEEVVGEIEDEYDPKRRLMRKAGERSYIIDARMEVSALRDALGLQLPAGEYETIAGYLLNYFKEIPRQGRTLQIGNFSIEVESSNERAIERVRLTKTS